MVEKSILVVDDEESICTFFEITLKKEGYKVTTTTDPYKAIKLLKDKPYDLLITDIRMPKIDGFGLVEKAKEINPAIPIIMITAFESTDTVHQAMKKGVFDYITKPFKVKELREAIKNALSLPIEKEKDTKTKFPGIIGKSPQMIEIFDLIEKIAPSKSNVLISGESGTGKELVARAIHNLSQWKDRPFITINCGGLPETLLESELFGHVRGAFTGATYNKIGLFELAHTGTVFLDEIGDLSPTLQVKLLRVIQDKTFKKVGGTDNIKVDVRIISATNKDLEKEVIEGKFREDLFYRLNVIRIHIPPLRERKEDIRPLVQYFLEKYSKQMGVPVRKISSYVLNTLENYSFPGNVRELENIIERSVALGTSNIILPDSFNLSRFKTSSIDKKIEIEIPPEGIDLEKFLASIEKDLIKKAIKMSEGIKKKAAELLNLNLRSFRYKLEKYNLDKD
ncbi:MAG: sigma-54-dependent Fis family transcriptional regulator [Deltaproteobacteria bacterium]|nr:MAG: sigma-54-dependent Fis family transcriptional regulator [Deltaproteobacteria bacterium]